MARSIEENEAKMRKEAEGLSQNGVADSSVGKIKGLDRSTSLRREGGEDHDQE